MMLMIWTSQSDDDDDDDDEWLNDDDDDCVWFELPRHRTENIEIRCYAYAFATECNNEQHNLNECKQWVKAPP